MNQSYPDQANRSLGLAKKTSQQSWGRKFAWWMGTALMTTALLQGCGGGGGGGGGGSVIPAEPFPSPNVNVYRGVANPGELIELTLDPSAKSYSLVVTSSQFGVGSTPVTGTYHEEAGKFVDDTDPEVTFVVDSASGQTFGNFKVTTGTGAPLSLAVLATNQQTTNIADLVGTYSLVQLTATPVGSNAQAESAQLRVSANGSARVCETQAFSSSCKSLEGDDVIVQLEHAGNGLWSVKEQGVELARFYPRRIDGVISFFIDYAFSDDTGPRVGTGAVATSRPLTNGQFDGTYTCFRGSQVLTATLHSQNTLDIGGVTFLLTYNRGGSLVNGQWQSYNANGLVEGEVPGSVAGRLVMLPLGGKQIVGTGIDPGGQVYGLACVGS